MRTAGATAVQPEWRFLPTADDGDVARLREALSLSPTLARLAAQRVGGADVDAVRAFLNPSLSDVPPPSALPDMERAAARLHDAVRHRESVVIHGDYDTDGVTACAVMLRTFRALGGSARHRLPSRFEDGYGLSDDFVRQCLADGTRVVVTVDCGTSEHERIRALADGGVDVIVTDHHEPGARGIPDRAYAVLNPKRDDSQYPFRELTGVGVAFKLAWALCERAAGGPKVGPRLREMLVSLLPTVTLGTIADVAPLVAENRVLVAYGLRTMARGGAGISALLDVSRVDGGDVTARQVAFGLCPRLNAAGRLGDATDALDLLIEDDPARAKELAAALDRRNGERQALCHQLQAEADRLLRETHDLDQDPAILVAREGWHEGIIGIVAGRLAESYGRPAAVIAFPPGEDKGRGSARGRHGLNLYQALARSRDRLLSFGGHEQAAGFSVARGEVEALRREFMEECGRQTRERKLVPTLVADMELPLSEITGAFLRDLDRLRPFGQGNPAPVFVARGVRIMGTPRLMGREQRHFWFNATQGGVGHRAVVFNRTDWLRDIDAGRTVWDVAYSPALNTYFDVPRLEIHVEDMKPADA